MIDNIIADKVRIIGKNVDEINQLIAELYTQDVEVRISYKDSNKGEPPRIDLWRATEHVNYLKKDTENE